MAAALKRKFGRISLGGLHDEAEIRGHRKTYIGAMPGRIIQTIKRAGSSNPVIILDEIDKVTVSNHGDPSSALLEVLDPEQNTTFHDNYLDTEYDLSKVLFIATANNVANIPAPLRDRMEMINIPGYILEDKIQIARKHLIPKQLEAHGVPAKKQFRMGPKVIEKVIGEYTRESGVRALDKNIAKIVRTRAKNIGFDEQFKPEVTAADVEKILGVPRFQREEYEVGGIVGVVTGAGLDGGRRRHPVYRVDPDAGQGRPDDDGQPRRRDERVGHDRAAMGQGPQPGAGDRSGDVQQIRRAHPCARGRHSEGRAERRYHDGDFARVDLHRPQGQGTRRDDGRDDPPGPRDARRRDQGEDTGSQAGRYQRDYPERG